jgi:hypothetical protein
MGFCCGKRNKLAGETTQDITKFLELEIVDLKNMYENIQNNGKLIINSEFETADEIRLSYFLISIIQSFSTLKDLLEKNSTKMNKNVDLKIRIFKLIQDYSLLREKNFESEEVLIFYPRISKIF